MSSATVMVYIGSSLGGFAGGLIGWAIGGLLASVMLAFIGAFTGTLIGYLRSRREAASIWMRILALLGGTALGWGFAIFVVGFAAEVN